MWIYAVYSQGPETLHNGTPKMYVTFFTPRGGKTVVILKLFYIWSCMQFPFFGVCVCVSKPRRYFANLDMLIFLANEVKHDFVARWVAQPASRWPLDRANDDEGHMPHVLQLLNYSHQCLAC